MKVKKCEKCGQTFIDTRYPLVDSSICQGCEAKDAGTYFEEMKKKSQQKKLKEAIDNLVSEIYTATILDALVSFAAEQDHDRIVKHLASHSIAALSHVSSEGEIPKEHLSAIQKKLQEHFNELLEPLIKKGEEDVKKR